MVHESWKCMEKLFYWLKNMKGLSATLLLKGVIGL